jgi:hypothetical protein
MAGGDRMAAAGQIPPGGIELEKAAAACDKEGAREGRPNDVA